MKRKVFFKWFFSEYFKQISVNIFFLKLAVKKKWFISVYFPTLRYLRYFILNIFSGYKSLKFNTSL
jgi:hypothetical protein